MSGVSRDPRLSIIHVYITNRFIMSIYQINRVTLIGRLTHDPQAKTTQTGNPMTTLKIATNHSWKAEDGTWQKNADFHRVVLFGKLAEQAASHLKKGRRILVEGRLHTRSWKDEKEQSHSVTEVIAHTCIFMDATQQKAADAVEEPAEIFAMPVTVSEVTA
jgi:single stranded DNA-binding protein